MILFVRGNLIRAPLSRTSPVLRLASDCTVPWCDVSDIGHWRCVSTWHIGDEITGDMVVIRCHRHSQRSWVGTAAAAAASPAGRYLQNLQNAIDINVVLAVFNMIPLPLLDGGRVAVGLLPRALAAPLAGLERYGMAIIIGLLFVLPVLGAHLGLDLDMLRLLISGPARAIGEAVVRLTGNG